MNSRLRFYGIILLTAIYCYAVGAVAVRPVESVYASAQTKEQGRYTATVLGHLLTPPSPSEGSLNQLSDFTGPTLKNPPTDSWASVLVNGKLTATRLAQYQHFFHRLLIQYRKADLIFPFHYFW